VTRALRTLPALLLLAAAACGDAPPPPRRSAPPPPPPKRLEEEPPPQEQTSLYVYSPVNKRDPFQIVFAVAKANPQAASGRKPTPLQKWPLDALTVSMTVTGTSTPMAMLVDPEGRGWPVRIGDFVGQNWGKVTAIQRDQIVVTESITDHATGRVYPNNIPLKVPKTKEELEADDRLKQGPRGGSGGD
jgi:type IV pilus assembly protein PilP